MTKEYQKILTCGECFNVIHGKDFVEAHERVRQKPYIRSARKIGRNEPCPCNSGKKYKHCHGDTQ